MPIAGNGATNLGTSPARGSVSGGDTAAVNPVCAMDRPINILIVDDEPKNLTVLETVLDEPGYRLVRAESADDALLALLADEFALLILDIRMPGLTGFELAQMIKERKKTALVPIIFLTAFYNEDQHILEGYGAGAVDYLHKPVNPAILRSKVAVFAELHRKSREIGIANRALLAEVAERVRAEERLRELNNTLEQRVNERTEQLRESERGFRQMIDALPAAVYTSDARGNLTHFNPAAVQLSGRVPKLGIDRWCVSWKLYRADKTPLPPEASPMAVALQDGRAIRGAEIIVERPDGTSIWVLCYPTPIFDAGGKIAGGVNILIDVTDRKRIEGHISLLVSEVTHRSKNMLAVVEGIARHMIAASPEEFVQRFSDRIQALAASHDLLVKSEWKGIELLELVRTQLAHFDDLLDRRIVLAGPPVRVTVAAAQCIGMVVHELATNAAKHGALFNERGGVEIAWGIESGQPDERFAMSWTERGGPPVVAPRRSGFGSTVVKTMTELSLDGEVQLEYAPSGLIWRLVCPAAKALEKGVLRGWHHEQLDREPIIRTRA